MPKATRKSGNIFITIMLVISIIVLVFIIYFFVSPNLAYGLIMLVGVWFVDAFVKYSYEYPNETLFADLSFAAIFFFSGQVDQDKVILLPNVQEPLLLKGKLILPFIIGLVISWVGNLYLCRGLINPTLYLKSKNQTPFLWVLSFLLAFISVVVALLPQITELWI